MTQPREAAEALRIQDLAELLDRYRDESEWQSFMGRWRNFDPYDLRAEINRRILALSQQSSPQEGWPKSRDVRRPEDMGKGTLRVLMDGDCDVIVEVAGHTFGQTSYPLQTASVEFCVPGAGGGKSSNTRKALVALMLAMELDNAASPTPEGGPTP